MIETPAHVAVVGATGAVGEAMLSILAEREFPCASVTALASARSVGKTVAFGDRELPVADLAEHDFAATDIALFSAGGAVSRQYAPRAAAAGALVIDNSSEFRYDDEIPLVVPEVNPAHLEGYERRNIIANPNCSTMQLVVAIAPLHRRYGIDRINVATYQSVSGAGAKGVEELSAQTRALLAFQPVEREVFTDRIAFNIIPHIDAFHDNGYTREEMKLVWETRKILGDPEIAVNPTAARVPVFYGHSEAVHLELATDYELADVRGLLDDAPGVVVVDERRDGGYPTAASNATGADPVYVGRIRRDLSHPRGLNLWIVADNIRKGAALNAVQVAEYLVDSHS